MIRWITKKRQGELATFTMVYVLLFFVATVAFALQIREYISLKTHTEDALAASNLASAVIDIQDKKLSGWFNAGAEKAKGMSETLRLSNAIREEETKQAELYRQMGKYF